ncbi:DoxX family protein [Larkinella soli]|uniref:DoxX family protein n=1 Tax=Larkinella soli TaxID=1770527 RepID=UPI000FFCC21A|nr:DoxX family protein [Larkinella soli]
MKTTKIAYWILTGLFAFVMLGSAVPDILMVQMAADGFREIGLPTYLLPFVGIAKLLGVIAILVPGFPRLKEWAYAGLIYDLLGATYSIYSSGKEAANWLPITFFIALGFASYFYYHKRLKAGKAEPDRKPTDASVSAPAGYAFR